MTHSGHCLCGAVSWQFDGPVSWQCYCHCEDCRRNCAAPVAAYLGTPLEQFRWTGKAPETYNSSPGVTRSFCGTCGTPMAFQAERYAGEIHLYIATLDNPADIAPTFHVHYRERLPWFHLSDDLPKYDRNVSSSP